MKKKPRVASFSLLPIFPICCLAPSSSFSELQTRIKEKQAIIQEKQKKDEEKKKKMTEENEKIKETQFRDVFENLTTLFAKLSLDNQYRDKKKIEIMIERKNSRCSCNEHCQSCLNSHCYSYHFPSLSHSNSEIFSVEKKYDDDLIMFLIRSGFDIKPHPEIKDNFIVSMNK